MHQANVGQTVGFGSREHRHKGHPHPALRATFSRKREKGKLLGVCWTRQGAAVPFSEGLA